MFNKLLALMTVLLGSHYLLENSTPLSTYTMDKHSRKSLWVNSHLCGIRYSVRGNIKTFLQAS